MLTPENKKFVVIRNLILDEHFPMSWYVMFRHIRNVSDERYESVPGKDGIWSFFMKIYMRSYIPNVNMDNQKFHFIVIKLIT